MNRCFDRYREFGIAQAGLCSGATTVWARCGFDWADPVDARRRMRRLWVNEVASKVEMRPDTRANIEALLSLPELPSAQLWQELADAEDDDAHVYRLLLDRLCGLAMQIEL